MTIGDRVPATRRPGEKHPPERPTPGPAQRTPATPENRHQEEPTRVAKAVTGDCVTHAPASALNLPDCPPVITSGMRYAAERPGGCGLGPNGRGGVDDDQGSGWTRGLVARTGVTMETTCADDGSVLSAGAMAESMRLAMTRKTPEEALRSVIAMAVACAPCDQASITVLGPGRTLETVAASDDRVTKADRLQYDLREGPCLDAVFTDGVFRVEDLAADSRWPQWTPRATGLGLGACWRCTCTPTPRSVR